MEEQNLRSARDELGWEIQGPDQQSQQNSDLDTTSDREPVDPNLSVELAAVISGSCPPDKASFKIGI